MELILKYFPDLTEKQIAQFEALEDLYKDWNLKINVVSRKDIDELYLRHVLHSLAIAKVINFKDGSSLMDVGTGGGFPGIPLAVLFPNCQFHLVDSINKKLNVVREVMAGLELENVKVTHTRVEEINETYDFIISRAVAAMPTFVHWVKGKIAKPQNNDLKNGVIYLKGGDLTEELKDYQTTTIYNISDFFEEDFFETKKVVHLPLKWK
ncbi:16S rRNA (guanine527-N7)-methyltransferase [Mesoflavibacter sabulilitoris]|uniref:Ribosomal RNA small subunit methyltransferase G n=1 Tax=Mesoflavibacter zeaxanthinifaciens subsp. sabulilitoris TaxID=1520893 RepID=A0A2T1N7Q6_9FLAO|nr:16S rRNA (guanine(527)-N(7))-methyltransferase RsmG [Mesoflavibacter zeaxanthinifaciens]MBB3123915.1 16S rRNA (guanine527-N7)-methyltransferase [Mesoflavibacter zeaxanthinifaciens subsp. sabulilitoris]PSG87906.1 16S rRNA (guanine(527)-N(7))-methyltransferase RsmG [Mesoflavibacter zeaxanthinifaciens subsp. sabulilitoris]